MLRTRKVDFSDSELIGGIQSGENNIDPFLEFMYRKFRPQVFAYILNNGGDEQEAEEVLHFGIIRVFENIVENKFKQKSSIGSYLYAICRNHWINQRKKSARLSPLTDDQAENIADEGTDPLGFMAVEEHRKGVSRLLSQVGDACRQLLIWSDGEGRPMKWISEKLGYKSVQAAMNKKSKCKKQLKEIVRKKPGFLRLIREILS